MCIKGRFLLNINVNYLGVRIKNRPKTTRRCDLIFDGACGLHWGWGRSNKEHYFSSPSSVVSAPRNLRPSATARQNGFIHARFRTIGVQPNGFILQLNRHPAWERNRSNGTPRLGMVVAIRASVRRCRRRRGRRRSHRRDDVLIVGDRILTWRVRPRGDAINVPTGDPPLDETRRVDHQRGVGRQPQHVQVRLRRLWNVQECARDR